MERFEWEREKVPFKLIYLIKIWENDKNMPTHRRRGTNALARLVSKHISLKFGNKTKLLLIGSN